MRQLHCWKRTAFLMQHTRAVILIVEDEFLLRMNAAEMIEDAGFDVVEASSAAEAIAVLEARTDIHVVFTDIQMPGSMDGLKLARFVRGDGRPSKSSRPPTISGPKQEICRKAASSWRSHIDQHK